MATRPDGLTSAGAAADEVDQRVTAVAQGADFSAIAHALAAARGPILQRWLEVTARQPFHADRPDQTVADHIPALFDAVVLLLARAMRPDQEVDAPLDDGAIVQSATTHAQVRFEQGLRSVDIVTEFRLLRQ
ncbi:MAG: RsbRD N-terminal domain-containing protein, partial [Candidatus Limnocylindrales bacterium]